MLLFLASRAATAADSSTVEAAVTLEREAFQAEEVNGVSVWLSNPTYRDISGVTLRVDAPPFFKFMQLPSNRESCPRWQELKRKSAQREIPLGPLAAHQARVFKLCLGADEAVKEGDFNLLFAFRTQWSEEGATRSAVSRVEKKVAVGLLGTESVGGFSLRLVVLIVPGLIALSILRLFKFKYFNELGTLEQTAFCALTSIALITLASLHLDLEKGISLVSLIELSALGGVLALLVGGSIKLYQKALELRREALDTKAGAMEGKLLPKLFRNRRKRHNRNILVITKDARYLGSAFIPFKGQGNDPSKDNGGFLAGWFEVDPEGLREPAKQSDRERLRDQFSHLERRGRWEKMLRLAQETGLEHQVHDMVKVEGQGEWTSSAWSFLNFGPGEVRALEETLEGPRVGPLCVA